MNKEIIRQNVGIDVSKEDFEVSFMQMDNQLNTKVKGSRHFSNNATGFQLLLQWVEKKAIEELPLSFTMEATGVYYENLAYFLYEQGLLVHVVLPNQSKNYTASLGLKSKTDKIDARALAMMGLERKLRLWNPTSPDLKILKQLTRERDSLVKERTSVSNRLHALRHQAKPNQDSITRSQAHIGFLDHQIKEIEKEIKAAVSANKTLETKLNLLQSIPGVGMITAAIIAAETNGFACIDSIRQLTSFAGLDIKIRESGKWKGKSRISKKGNSRIRKALYMPSLSKIGNDASTQKYYQRIKEKKGKGIIAVVAVQRKLLSLMYTLWKKEEMFLAA